MHYFRVYAVTSYWHSRDFVQIARLHIQAEWELGTVEPESYKSKSAGKRDGCPCSVIVYILR